MVKIIPLAISCLFMCACVKDSLRIRNDFSVESHTANDIDFQVTLRGSKWNTYDRNGVNVNEWVGPYRLRVYFDIPTSKQSSLNITNIEISYTDGGPVLTIPAVTLEKTEGKRENRYQYLHRLADNLKLQSISVVMSYEYNQGSSVIFENVSFVIEPKITEQPYNRFWAMIMSV